jgi:hypothetical protein
MSEELVVTLVSISDRASAGVTRTKASRREGMAEKRDCLACLAGGNKIDFDSCLSSRCFAEFDDQKAAIRLTTGGTERAARRHAGSHARGGGKVMPASASRCVR